jgi:hypothetical protein
MRPRMTPSPHLQPSQTAMKTSDRIVTGAETPSGDGSAMDALIAFYRAFNNADLDALAHNWAPADLPSMDNPLGGIRRGWEPIRQGYQRLFEGPAKVTVAFFDFTSQGSEGHHLFVGRERGWCITPTARIELRIRTSRWFVRMDGQWRQLHHHGSIEEPALLASYQRAVLGSALGD